MRQEWHSTYNTKEAEDMKMEAEAEDAGAVEAMDEDTTEETVNQMVMDKPIS